MTDTQYSTGVSREGIERALITAGLHLNGLRPADLAPLEDFHTMDRIATHQLVELLELTSDALPFADATFDVVFSQHVQMNVADKAGLYADARRVLREGGRLALWDITSGDSDELDFPLPWADHPGQSHLATPDGLHTAIEEAGFAIDHWADLTADAAALMQAVLAAAPNPLGLHAFVVDFEEKAKNLTAARDPGVTRQVS